MVRKGEVDKVIPGRPRVEKISEWRKSIDSFISCRKLSRMVTENRRMGGFVN